MLRFPVLASIKDIPQTDHATMKPHFAAHGLASASPLHQAVAAQRNRPARLRAKSGQEFAKVTFRHGHLSDSPGGTGATWEPAKTRCMSRCSYAVRAPPAFSGPLNWPCIGEAAICHTCPPPAHTLLATVHQQGKPMQ